jgi:thioredoxin-related protein/YHS domain-containing protein
MPRRLTWDQSPGGPNALIVLIAGLSSIALSATRADAGLFDATSNAVPFRTDLGAAQAEAKERDLILWIQFTGPWCPNCRRMERGAFVHQTVVSLAKEKFVPVKLRSDEYESLALNLGLSVLPSTVLVRPNGEVINKFEGYGDPTEFYAFLQENLIKEGRSGKDQLAKKAEPKAPASSSIALASYCPVTLVEQHKLVAGRPELSVPFSGKQYRFATATARDAFLARPERFVPVNGGMSPVGQVDGGESRLGDPRWGVIYKGHLFLCGDQSERDLFLLNPERYAHVGEVERARGGDRHGLWALVRRVPQPNAPSLGHAPNVEPLQLQALRTPTDTLRR